MKTKVLYLCSNTKENLINLYYDLRKKFDGLVTITTDEIDGFLSNYGKFYVKELSYQFEIYNLDNEYVFCINKSN